MTSAASTATEATAASTSAEWEYEEQPKAAPPVQFDGEEAGVVHDLDRVQSVYIFGAAVAVLAVISVVPGLGDVVDHFRSYDSPGIDVWALLTIALGGIQFAYAVYVIQIPDWSTVRMAAGYLVLVAAFYALVLGVAMVVDRQNGFVSFLQIDQEQQDGRAAGWSFIMLCLTGALCYMAGRLAMRWKREDDDEWEELDVEF